MVMRLRFRRLTPATTSTALRFPTRNWGAVSSALWIAGGGRFFARVRGGRTADEMRAFLIAQMRRRMGLVAVQAMARHRLARIQYIGVPRAVVEGRRRRGDVQPVGRWFVDDDYFAYQAARVG